MLDKVLNKCTTSPGKEIYNSVVQSENVLLLFRMVFTLASPRPPALVPVLAVGWGH